MNVRGIGQTNNVVNLYSKNQNKVNGTREIQKKDSIQISNEARVLMNYGDRDIKTQNDASIEALRNQIKNGTYNVDAKLTAKALIDTMKGRRF